MKYLPLLLLCGCAPYVGYTHLSKPNIADDGYDLVCLGAESQKGRIRAGIAACENVHEVKDDGTYVKADVRVFLGRKQ